MKKWGGVTCVEGGGGDKVKTEKGPLDWGVSKGSFHRQKMKAGL